MKSIIIVLFAAFMFTTNAFANGYCDSRPNQNDYDNCYRMAIETQTQNNGKAFQRLYNSPRYSSAQKQNLENNQVQWWNDVRAQCRTSSCIEQSLIYRSNELSAEYRKISK